MQFSERESVFGCALYFQRIVPLPQCEPVIASASSRNQSYALKESRNGGFDMRQMCWTQF
jgi:hypothetical protein